MYSFYRAPARCGNPSFQVPAGNPSFRLATLPSHSWLATFDDLWASHHADSRISDAKLLLPPRVVSFRCDVFVCACSAAALLVSDPLASSSGALGPALSPLASRRYPPPPHAAPPSLRPAVDPASPTPTLVLARIPSAFVVPDSQPCELLLPSPFTVLLPHAAPEFRAPRVSFVSYVNSATSAHLEECKPSNTRSTACRSWFDAANIARGPEYASNASHSIPRLRTFPELYCRPGRRGAAAYAANETYGTPFGDSAGSLALGDGCPVDSDRIQASWRAPRLVRGSLRAPTLLLDL
ncbi:hypothetical protein B0H17DRAFT_1144913 [Mycena rosella]|uniref:Uncharacterized protein n=1 Tax=Mycena rosella TaxID=1033263 RepID=A0AAD7G6I2_MYCRO|nr:hypothetical protein B0H17DRAFT_1144913 [Mycena rosella]